MGSKNIYLPSYHHLQRGKKSLFTFLSLVLLLLLTYNSVAIFTFQVTQLNTIEKSFELPLNESRKMPQKIFTHLPHQTQNSVVSAPKRRGRHKHVNKFSERAKEFFSMNSCKLRFFMTWISSVESLGERELFTLESLFKYNPNSCLLILSDSMDSIRGMQILRPFLSKKFRVIAISPDFNYLLKHTPAEGWFSRLKRGMVNPGEISLGQNLSNLLRLALLYKFGGVYLDTDFVILRSLSKVRNSIGAQTLNPETKNWSRLNNAVMIFDKGHPILYKFIEEFALTFDGNKWGHNGPYLVSRVVSRENRKGGIEINILKPIAFYPVDWSRISGFFHGPKNMTHARWLSLKYYQIRNDSYGVHLWNKQSRKLKIERGSIISLLIYDSCIFCDSLKFIL